MIKAHSAMILSLAIASMMNVVTAPKIKKVRASISSEEAAPTSTSSTAKDLEAPTSPEMAAESDVTCDSSSPQCCWVVRSWQQMGKSTSVSSTSSTACCYYFVSTIPLSVQTNNFQVFQEFIVLLME